MRTKIFTDFLSSEYVYTVKEKEKILQNLRNFITISRNNKKESFLNIPCAFDIETSSFRLIGNDEKCALMYIWTFGIFGMIVQGRTWQEFISFLNYLQKNLYLSETVRLVCYVHNLQFEFGFLYKYFKWKKIFALKQHTPIYAIAENNIEFRCSYILTGYSLEKLKLEHFNIEKLSGFLNYDLIRHPKTELTEKEKAYCINDVKKVMAYIEEQIQKEKGIQNIPLTKTGYIRRYCRDSCFNDENGGRKKYYKFQNIIKPLKLEPEEFTRLHEAFQGGFTHQNPFKQGKVIENVTSFDFCSCYPAMLVQNEFPMGKGELYDLKSEQDLEVNLQAYCCLFVVEFFNLKPKLFFENYISISRCRLLKNSVVNNGRLVSADHCVLTVTECDYKIIRNFYSWDERRIYFFRRYIKDYLPTDFVKCILNLYKKKTELKNIPGYEYEYMVNKELLNSCYGFLQTSIVRDEITFDGDEWGKVTPDLHEAIKKYNNARGRFIFYPWGVWTCQFQRLSLFSAILEFGKSGDYVYSDTDSVKVENAELHKEYIEDYNKTIQEMIKRALNFHKIPEEYAFPINRKGEQKPLGIWENEGTYRFFKTLGAKRYMVQKENGEYSLTVSGLNKTKALPYIIEKCKNNRKKIFDFFNDEMVIPAEYTGKPIRTYITEERKGKIEDYKGEEYIFTQKSGVHLENQEYSLKLSEEYQKYLAKIGESYE